MFQKMEQTAKGICFTNQSDPNKLRLVASDLELDVEMK